jgi:hypothetical protein
MLTAENLKKKAKGKRVRLKRLESLARQPSNRVKTMKKVQRRRARSSEGPGSFLAWKGVSYYILILGDIIFWFCDEWLSSLYGVQGMAVYCHGS